MEQHLYRKHLHIMGLAAPSGMLIFLIAFVSFTLETVKVLAEGKQIAAHLTCKNEFGLSFVSSCASVVIWQGKLWGFPSVSASADPSYSRRLEIIQAK
jgi:hypothetical protein